jgi:protein-serine/threonine kinase
MKPPIVPHQGAGVETPNFRNVKESHSVDIGASKVKGVPLDSGLATPMGEIADGDDHHDSSHEYITPQTSNSHR